MILCDIGAASLTATSSPRTSSLPPTVSPQVTPICAPYTDILYIQRHAYWYTGHLKFVDFGTAKDFLQPDLNGPEFVGEAAADLSTMSVLLSALLVWN